MLAVPLHRQMKCVHIHLMHIAYSIQLIAYTSVSAPNVKFGFCRGNWFWTHIWLCKCVWYSSESSERGRELKNRFYNHRSQKLMNWIPFNRMVNGKWRIKNTFIERNTFQSFDFPFYKSDRTKFIGCIWPVSETVNTVLKATLYHKNKRGFDSDRHNNDVDWGWW